MLISAADFDRLTRVEWSSEPDEEREAPVYGHVTSTSVMSRKPQAPCLEIALMLVEELQEPDPGPYRPRIVGSSGHQ